MTTFIKVMGERVGETEENAKSLDDGDKTLSISIFMLNKLHVLLYFSTYKYIVVCREYILLFRLVIYVFYSFNRIYPLVI